MNNVSKPTSVTDTFEVYKAGYPTSYAQRIRKDLVVLVVPSQFLEGGPGSSYLYPQGLLAFATPTLFVCFPLCGGYLATPTSTS